ncbi:hypothetical protein H0H87_003564, partial [Tephrocybe sp. NHM501043]
WDDGKIKSDSSSDGESKDEELAPPPTPKKKKKVTFSDRDRPTEKIVPASPPTPIDDRIDQMSKQLEDLVLSYAELNHAYGLPPCNNFLNVIINLQHCGICGWIGAHQVGYRYCTEMGQLINENLVKYNKGGQLVLMDGTELPRLTNNVSSMAQSIHD